MFVDINVMMEQRHSGHYQIIFILIRHIHHHNVHALIGLMMQYAVKIILVNTDIQIPISHALPQIYQPPISGWDHWSLYQQCHQVKHKQISLTIKQKSDDQNTFINKYKKKSYSNSNVSNNITNRYPLTNK